MTRAPRHLAALLLALAAGCSPAPEPAAADTGAREAARGYFTAVIGRDWAAGYALLHPDSRKGVSAAEYARRAEAYRGRLGFEPAAVHVRLAEERGAEASARVDLSGNAAGRHHFKESVALRRHDGQWLVLLPLRFGQR